jgi:spore maturation protein CgeB
MRIVIFCHSLISDWNHGNAHFLRGVVSELQARGNDVRVFEPENAWSVKHLLAEAGPGAIAGFHLAYPGLSSTRFDPSSLDLDAVLDGADLVLVHEWNDPALVKKIGRHRHLAGGYVLLFHDTHHRSVSDEAAMAAYDLRDYDGVLAFGDVIRDRYVSKGWAPRAWTWHEAADTHMFAPATGQPCDGDLVWIGNWGDGERSEELHRFLIDPVAELKLRARVHGVRYPAHGRAALAGAGIEYRGWLPNYRVPAVFSRFRVTVHVPRRPYVESLPGIPTIRVFEALACGIPLVSAPWRDDEGLFTEGKDYLGVRNGAEMTRALADVLRDGTLASSLAAHGQATIRARHTCAHRVDELLAIVDALRGRNLERAVSA